MQAILEQNFITNSITERQNDEKIGIIATLFGCWHKDLGRPFSNGNETHRSCLQCGARKHFDSQTLKTSGPFFYPQKVSNIK